MLLAAAGGSAVMAWLGAVREAARLGLRGSADKVLRYNLVKPTGVLVGEDKFGNKYYENKEDMVGRDRWVEYANGDYDASQVTPEWHAWLHHVHDVTPKNPFFNELKPKYGKEYVSNQTGTERAYKQPHNFRSKEWERADRTKYSKWNPADAAADEEVD